MPATRASKSLARVQKSPEYLSLLAYGWGEFGQISVVHHADLLRNDHKSGGELAALVRSGKKYNGNLAAHDKRDMTQKWKHSPYLVEVIPRVMRKITKCIQTRQTILSRAKRSQQEVHRPVSFSK